MTDFLLPNDIDIDEIDETALAAKVELPKTGKYYRATQTSSDKYKEFRIIDIDKERGIEAAIGIFEENGVRKSDIQSYLFSKDKFSKQEVQEWLKNHKQSKANFDVSCEIIDVDSSVDERVRAAKKIEKDKDLMYVKFRYVHEGANKNNDLFLAEELEERHSTAIYKPINLGHKDISIIGSIYDTEFINREKSDNGKAAVNIYGVIYKWIFPDAAKEITDRHSKGKLHISMETWFKEAQCSVCGNIYKNEDDYCNCLKERYTVANNKRVLKGITFGGAGIVEDPADEDAIALSIAEVKSLKDRVSKREEIRRFESIINEATNLFYNIVGGIYSNDEKIVKDKKKELSNLINDIKSLLDTVNVNKIAKGELIVAEENVYTKEVVDILIAHAKADEKKEFETALQTELDKVKSSMQTQIDNLNKDIDTLKAEKISLESVKAEYDQYKANVDKQKKLSERKTVLTEKNIKLPENSDDILSEMSDEVFGLFVKANEKENNEDSGKANASLNINDGVDNNLNEDNDVILNGIKKL